MKISDILYKKLCYLLHRSLVDIRNSALANQCEKVADLADTFEILPTLLADWEESHLELVRSILASFEARQPEENFNYLSILDMDDKQFLDLYCTPGGYR